MKNIVLCYPVSDEDRQRIAEAAPDDTVTAATQATIGEEIFTADIYCGHAKVPIDWSAVVRQGRLKWIQSSAAGLDHCLVPPVRQSDILISGCSGLFANQVAEQTLALLYGGLRAMPHYIRQQQQHVFQRGTADVMHGKTVAIAGFGCNGQRIARLLRDVASSILATDVFHDQVETGDVELLPATETDQLFRRAEVVIATLPLTPGTEGCLGEAQFRLLKPGSYFVNVGRGRLVDHAALLAAIERQQIAFAGLDVVDPEPLPANSPLWDCERVLITPHMGAVSPDRTGQVTELFCRNLHRFREKRPLINQVDPDLPFPRPSNRLRLDRWGLPIWPGD